MDGYTYEQWEEDEYRMEMKIAKREAEEEIADNQEDEDYDK